MTLEIIPTGAALGAEIRGVDLSQPVSEDIKEQLRQAWSEHLVLLFRDQQLEQEDMLSASQIFGGVQMPGARKYQVAGGHQVGGKRVSQIPEVGILTNLGEDGKPVLDNGTLGSFEVDWHTDNSYVEIPPAGSFLYSVQVPVDGGGDTSFNNQYLAWETLPDDLKAAARDKQQVHDLSRNSAGVLRPTAKLPTTPEEVEGPVHPLVRRHPVSGREALYLGRRRKWPSNYIVGLSNDDSVEFLARLWQHATQPQFAWTHYWRAGDAVLWDNRCTMHYRTAVDPTQSRIMYRTVIKGEAVIAA